jgi:dihydrofolate synthase/folylpolyglutamate synthase
MLAELLPAFDCVYFTRYANNPRGVPVEELTRLARELGAHNHSPHATLEDAWNAAKEVLRGNTLLCVTGSFFIAAEMRELFALESGAPSAPS